MVHSTTAEREHDQQRHGAIHILKVTQSASLVRFSATQMLTGAEREIERAA